MTNKCTERWDITYLISSSLSPSTLLLFSLSPFPSLLTLCLGWVTMPLMRRFQADLHLESMFWQILCHSLELMLNLYCRWHRIPNIIRGSNCFLFQRPVRVLRCVRKNTLYFSLLQIIIIKRRLAWFSFFSLYTTTTTIAVSSFNTLLHFT